MREHRGIVKYSSTITGKKLIMFKMDTLRNSSKSILFINMTISTIGS